MRRNRGTFEDGGRPARTRSPASGGNLIPNPNMKPGPSPKPSPNPNADPNPDPNPNPSPDPNPDPNPNPNPNLEGRPRDLPRRDRRARQRLVRGAAAEPAERVAAPAQGQG